MESNETATRLMDTAQGLIMERGYNAFSYKDLADEVGIRKASIHYHFPAKGDLGLALMRRYIANLDATLEHIDRTGRTSRSKLKSFIKLYAETESCGAICLCGSLASDRETLPSALQDAVTEYIQKSEAWVEKHVATGIESGEFHYRGKTADAATALLSGLQGGLIIARASTGRASLLASVQRVFFKTLETE